MSYYIISFEPEQMKLFQKRYSFLVEAFWIKEKKNLAQLISSPSGDEIFFVHLNGNRELIDELVLIIRDGLIDAKIIYVVNDLKAVDLKSHQMTPVGGDAYVPLDVENDKFNRILKDILPPEFNQRGNRLEGGQPGTVTISDLNDLIALKNNSKSKELELIFSEVFQTKNKKPIWQSVGSLAEAAKSEDLVVPEFDVGDSMSDKDQELSLDDLGDLELSSDGSIEVAEVEDGGLDLDLNEDIGLDLSEANEVSIDDQAPDSGMDLDLDESFSLDDAVSVSAEDPDASDDVGFSLGDDLGVGEDEAAALDYSENDSDDVSLDFANEDSLDLGGSDEDNGLSLSLDDADSVGLVSEDDNIGLSLDDSDDLGVGDVDLSEDAKEKLKEIDAIMDFDASKVGITMDLSQGNAVEIESEDLNLGLSMGDDDDALDFSTENSDSDIETSLVSDELDLGSINFSNEEEDKVAAPVLEEKNKKKVKEVKEAQESYYGGMGKELKEISGAYSGEMERMQATISNLRVDREELLAKIQKLEEDKVLQNRQSLTMRAELDEKKIELSIIRKKNNDEVSELKDRMKLFEEKKLILEEKNRIMAVELDKSVHKNKIDVKKVQMRERELEQKLELLKADSESQIRHRDLKILELKRKLDAMEFDIESISVQEKRSVESRFELEDKLDKAIKTLRNAITVLEDESDKSGTLETLKKNIDM